MDWFWTSLWSAGDRELAVQKGSVWQRQGHTWLAASPALEGPPRAFLAPERGDPSAASVRVRWVDGCDPVGALGDPTLHPSPPRPAYQKNYLLGLSPRPQHVSP